MAVFTRAGLPAPVLLFLLFLLLRLHPCRGQEDSYELVSGDVTLSAMLSLNGVQNDGCGAYDVDELKEVTAVEWFLQRLNANNYIPGVNIGLDVYRSCQSAERATRNAVTLMEKYRVLDPDPQDVNRTTPLLGLLGPGRTQDAMAVSGFLSSLPAAQRLLQISASATGAVLSNKNIYSNFFRVIPPDSTQVQVLVKLLQQLEWNYISIVYQEDAYGREAAEQLRDLAKVHGLCVPSFQSLPLDYRSGSFNTAADGIIDRIKGGSSSSSSSSTSGGSSDITGVVYIGSAATAQEFLTRLADRVRFVHFIFSEALALQTSVLAKTVLGPGSLVAAPPSLPLPEFKAYWNGLWNNWTTFTEEMKKNGFLRDYYQTTTACSFNDRDDTCYQAKKSQLPLIQDDSQWLFEYYNVKAAAIFAALLKKLHQTHCGAAATRGVCPGLKAALRDQREAVQALVASSTWDLEAEFIGVSAIFRGQSSVGFDAQGELSPGEHNGSLYNVFNYRLCQGAGYCFVQVGTYSASGDLALDRGQLAGYDHENNNAALNSFPRAQCKDGYDCLECVPDDIAADILFVPGDVYVVAVAPLHDRLANSPQQCGALRQAAGTDLVQGVLYALQEVNKKDAPFTGLLGDKTLGLIVLNSCHRELVIQDRLLQLHKGSLALPDGRNSSHVLPHIAGYLGGFFSSVSQAMYEVLSKLDTRFVMLSPTNTSPELSDRSKYPFFLRLTSGQNTLVTMLLKLTRDLGHQYVQIVYDPDDIYSLAVQAGINSASKSFNICVVNNVASDPEKGSFYDVLDDLRKFTWAPVVILALQADHLKKVMKDILPEMEDSDQFLLMGTDGWGRSADLLASPGKERLLGTLTLSVELPLDRLFDEYFKNTDPLNSTDPWLKYWWEAKAGCYFDGSFQRRDKPGGQCPPSAALTATYVQNLWVPFYIQAFYALALGVHAAVTDNCGQPFLCAQLTSQQLRDALMAVRLDLFNNGQAVSVFDANGDGNVGYKLYQVSPDTASSTPGALTYDEVGRFEHDSLTLYRKEELWAYLNRKGTRCPNANACNICFPTNQTGGNSGVVADDSSDNQGAVIGMAVVIVILIIAVVLLVIVLVLGRRRLRGQREKNDDQKLGLDNLGATTPPRGGSVSSRPLPAIQELQMSAQSAGGAGGGGGGGGGGSPRSPNDSGGSSLAQRPLSTLSYDLADVNNYDYLQHDHSPREQPNRNSYLQLQQQVQELQQAIGLPHNTTSNNTNNSNPPSTPSSVTSRRQPHALSEDSNGYIPVNDQLGGGGSRLPSQGSSNGYVPHHDHHLNPSRPSGPGGFDAPSQEEDGYLSPSDQIVVLPTRRRRSAERGGPQGPPTEGDTHNGHLPTHNGQLPPNNGHLPPNNGHLPPNNGQAVLPPRRRPAYEEPHAAPSAEEEEGSNGYVPPSDHPVALPRQLSSSSTSSTSNGGTSPRRVAGPTPPPRFQNPDTASFAEPPSSPRRPNKGANYDDDDTYLTPIPESSPPDDRLQVSEI